MIFRIEGNSTGVKYTSMSFTNFNAFWCAETVRLGSIFIRIKHSKEDYWKIVAKLSPSNVDDDS